MTPRTVAKSTQITADRNITAAEVKDWFGSSSQGRLPPAQHDAIAAYLTEKMIWPCDSREAHDELRQDGPDGSPYWDFGAAANAAKLLQGSMPAMLNHWNGLRWAPETRGGHPAISKLQEALAEALPHIEWPFDHYKRRPRTGQKNPKQWHLPAVLIAKAVIKALVETGHNNPSLERNSLVPGVVRRALIRMRFANETLEATTVSAHLSRWDKKFGLKPSTVTRLIAKGPGI